MQHILASTYSGRCIVWDLRKNEPIIKVSDSMSRVCMQLSILAPRIISEYKSFSRSDNNNANFVLADKVEAGGVASGGGHAALPVVGG